MAELDEAVIFIAARNITCPEEREAYLRAACGNDPKAYQGIVALLQTYEKDPTFLETSPAELGLRRDSALLSEGPGTVIGRYKLLERIGEGGFAVVYLAEQTEPLRRQVALKIIKLGMDTRQVIARFEAERQALALMDHPGIAKVYDAGATETGRPYFVMQIIRGVPITEYCDTNRLTTEARLRLFMDVCRAVQHAHQKGIIHRDIKPTNVLVALHDGRPIAKVIDFGIAKAVRQRLTEKTLYTSYRQIIGTPQYMSPEQAEFSDLDIDTRSDIYSLGVLLYELLTSTTPLAHDDLERMGYDDVCHTIRHSEPPTPSRRLSTLGDAETTAAANRQLDPAGLRKVLRGDLDWIVMKALEIDRTRRYETADALAADIQRHLTHEPIAARPPTAAYQLRKFVAKHRGPVAAAAAILATLLLALNLAVVGLVRINHERQVADTARQQAEKNLVLAQRLIRDVLAPVSSRLGAVTDDDEVQRIKADMLEQALQFAQEVLLQNPKDPNTRLELARLCDQLGEMAWWTGEKRELTCRRAISIFNELLAEAPDNPTYLYELCVAHGHLGRLLWNELRWKESLDHWLTAVRVGELLVNKAPNEPMYRKELYDSHQGSAFVLAARGELAEAEKHFREAVKDIQSPSAHYQLADLLMSVNRFVEAKVWLDEGLTIAERSKPESAGKRVYQSHWIAEFHQGLSRVHSYQGELDQAESYLQQAIAGHEQYIRDLSFPSYYLVKLGWSYYHLCELKILQGRLTEAEQAARQSLDAWSAMDTPIASQYAGLGHFHLGGVLHWEGSLDEARSHFQQAAEKFEKIPDLLSEEPYCQSWRILLLANCPDQSFCNPKLSVEIANRVITDSHAPLWRLLALSQYRSGAWQDAHASLQKSMAMLGGGDAMDWLLMAMIQWRLGEHDKAVEWYQRAQDAISSRQPILYGDIGVLGFKRLVAEAATTLSPFAPPSEGPPPGPNPGL